MYDEYRLGRLQLTSCANHSLPRLTALWTRRAIDLKLALQDECRKTLQCEGSANSCYVSLRIHPGPGSDHGSHHTFAKNSTPSSKLILQCSVVTRSYLLPLSRYSHVYHLPRRLFKIRWRVYFRPSLAATSINHLHTLPAYILFPRTHYFPALPTHTSTTRPLLASRAFSCIFLQVPIQTMKGGSIRCSSRSTPYNIQWNI